MSLPLLLFPKTRTHTHSYSALFFPYKHVCWYSNKRSFKIKMYNALANVQLLKSLLICNNCPTLYVYWHKPAEKKRCFYCSKSNLISIDMHTIYAKKASDYQLISTVKQNAGDQEHKW